MAHPLDSQIQQLEGGSIRPLRILEREQNRLPASETLELIEQCRERPAAMLRGAERGAYRSPNGIESSAAKSGATV